VRAILRRVNVTHEPGPRVLRVGDIVIDEGPREVRVRGHVATLKPREFEMLLLLAANAGLALSREQLLQRVWGFDFVGDERTIDVHVRRLRSKLEEDFALPPYIHTVHGFGYRFAPPE